MLTEARETPHTANQAPVIIGIGEKLALKAWEYPDSNWLSSYQPINILLHVAKDPRQPASDDTKQTLLVEFLRHPETGNIEMLLRAKGWTPPNESQFEVDAQDDYTVYPKYRPILELSEPNGSIRTFDAVGVNELTSPSKRGVWFVDWQYDPNVPFDDSLFFSLGSDQNPHSLFSAMQEGKLTLHFEEDKMFGTQGLRRL